MTLPCPPACGLPIPPPLRAGRARFLALWLCRLPTDRLARRDGPAATPRVVWGQRGSARRLVALDAAAARLGLRPGQSVAEALALYPDLVAVPEAPDADRALLDAIASACERYTPLVGVPDADLIVLDIGGSAHLFGGEDGLMADAAARLDRVGLTARMAAADTIGAAIAVARYGAGGILAPGAQRDALAGLPLAALRLPAPVVDGLEQVGLKRIGDLAGLPRAPLAARFGEDLLMRLDQASGDLDEPLSPRRPVAPYLAERRFAEPVGRVEDVLAALGGLARQMAALLERHGMGARHLALALFRTDGAVRHLAVGTARPLRDPVTVTRLFGERIAAMNDDIDPGFGFDMLRLAVTEAAPFETQAPGLGAPDPGPATAALIERLSARLGSDRVLVAAAADGHRPELASLYVPARTADRAGDRGLSALARHLIAEDMPARPLRLLARPEPVEALAEVPDGPPLRFRWRKALHEVAAAEGPERIEGVWWSGTGEPARDYFRIEDRNGRRFWLYRAGLYRSGETPRWFLHGIDG
jgi:protein ImuB